jgi:hypothetical protein
MSETFHKKQAKIRLLSFLRTGLPLFHQNCLLSTVIFGICKKTNTKEYLHQSGLDYKLLFFDINGIIKNNDHTKHEQL